MAGVTIFFEITREGRIIIKSEINEIKACQNVLKDLVNMLISQQFQTHIH